MVTIHIYMRAKAPSALEQTYREIFAPAMARQKGFVLTRLLQEFGSEDRYGVEVCFRSEDERLVWAGSPEHDDAWARIEAACEEITWKEYDIVGAMGAGS